MPSRRVFFALTWQALSRAAAQQKAPRKLGLQLYSLRREATADLPKALAAVRSLGFTELEVGDLFKRTPAEFKKSLADHGLKPISMGAEWKQLGSSIDSVIDQARALGVQYVTCSQIPRKKRLTLDDATRAADSLNRWGEALASSKLQLAYHIHGYEFVPGPDGTLFDTLAKRMDKRFANFEMDVFWVVFGNEDPVKLLNRYSGRFPLMHVKDIRKGEPRTFDPGTVEEEASVPLGTGEVSWPPLFAAARQHGVRHYFLEEEHPNTIPQIRQSLGYLEKIEALR